MVGRDLLPELLDALDFGAELLEEVGSQVDAVLEPDGARGETSRRGGGPHGSRVGTLPRAESGAKPDRDADDWRADTLELLREVAALSRRLPERPAGSPPGPNDVERMTAPVDALVASLSEGLAAERDDIVPAALRLGLAVGRAEHPPWAWEACLPEGGEDRPDDGQMPPGLRAALPGPGRFVGAAACEVTPRVGWRKEIQNAAAAAGVTAQLPDRPRLESLPLGRRRLDADSADRLHHWLSAVDAAAVACLSVSPETDAVDPGGAVEVPAGSPPVFDPEAPPAVSTADPAGTAGAGGPDPLADFHVGPFGLAVKLPTKPGEPAFIARKGLDRPPLEVSDLIGNIIGAFVYRGEAGAGKATPAEIASAWASAGEEEAESGSAKVRSGLQRAKIPLRKFGLTVVSVARVRRGGVRELRELPDGEASRP